MVWALQADGDCVRNKNKVRWDSPGRGRSWQKDTGVRTLVLPPEGLKYEVCRRAGAPQGQMRGVSHAHGFDFHPKQSGLHPAGEQKLPGALTRTARVVPTLVSVLPAAHSVWEAVRSKRWVRQGLHHTVPCGYRRRPCEG